MLLSWVLYLAGTFIGILFSVFAGLASSFEFVLPTTSIETAWATIVGYSGYFYEFFPVDTLFTIFALLANLILIKYLILIILWVIRFVPRLGQLSSGKLPEDEASENVTDLSQGTLQKAGGRSNVLDLRHGRIRRNNLKKIIRM